MLNDVQRDLKHRPEALAHANRLLRTVGGSTAARVRLQAIAETWQTRAPLHAAILLRFLDGQARSEIVRWFVERHLYEDSRIYSCINELPDRIAHELRLAQASVGDV